MGRPNKVWFRKDIRWWVTNIGGKQHRLAKGKKNKAEAERVFHELMAVRPQSLDGQFARVCDLAEAFLQNIQRLVDRGTFSQDTYRGYYFYLMGFSEFRGYRLAREIIPHDVTDWLATNKWNDTSEYNAKRHVFRLFSWATEEGLLAKNPLKGMKREKPEPKRRCLTEEEYCSLLRGARRPFRVFIWSLMETGARPSELRRLKWDEVQGSKCVIKKHKTVKKTGKPRVIFLTERMQKRIKQLRERSTSPYVFVNTRNEPWTENAIRLQVDRIKKRCGLADDVCVYLVRHTYATWALMRGVGAAHLAEILGHRDTTMIMEVYSHLADQKVHMLDIAEQAARRPARPKPSANGKRLSA